ncbi:uncharacterized protein BDW70DRAFT_153039 [Aspergillus foveolatus]|uniref:uncharacterized protein n=1 Tax=Aspergillus foveolatus TaxID=210207 RepID=UPI003CCE198D
MNDTSSRRRWWTQEEDCILQEEVKRQIQLGGHQGARNWSAIAEKLPGRTNKDCRKRWTKISLSSRKGTWTAAEDHLLRKAVARFGFQWTKVAEMVGSRHPDQCAKRWHHSLDPNVKRGPWAAEEDSCLLEAVQKIGRDWKEIGRELFPSRSTTDIKNRYVILSRRRVPSPASLENCSSIDIETHSSPLADSKPLIPTESLTPEVDFSIANTPCELDSSNLAPDTLNLNMTLPSDLPSYLSLPLPDTAETDLALDGSSTAWEVPDWTAFDNQCLFTPDASELDGSFTSSNHEEPPRPLPIHDIPGLSTLVLEDLRPETVNLVIDTLLRTNSKFGMRMYNTGS